MIATLLAVTLAAQAPTTPPPGEIEVRPIDCAWRTSKSAVEVGERFTLTITCTIVETERNTVVVDPNQLEATALSLVPFEVVSGRRHQDVVESPFRHFQYEFIVRTLGNAAFGQDVDMPALSIKYTIRSAIGGAEGRELRYVLPSLPMRMLSLVSTKAADIRESTDEAFRELETRRRRANNELAASVVAFGFSVVLLGLAFARVVGRYRSKTAKGVRPPLAPLALLRASLHDLQELNREVARDGWTIDRTARALAALRVTAAVGVGRTVAQSRVDADAPVREGQVPVRTGLFGSHNALVSAATSVIAIERKRTGPSTPKRAAKLAGPLDELDESLRVFTTTRYGRSGLLDAAALNAALEKGVNAAREVRRMNTWIH